MSAVDVFFCGALMLCWTRLCVALQVTPVHDPSTAETRAGLDTKSTFSSANMSAASTLSHQNAPCLLDDVLASMREGLGDDGELTNRSLATFGICTESDNSSGSVLLELANKTSRNQGSGLELLRPTGVSLAEEEETGSLALTFDLPQSPLLKLHPLLLLAFESPLTGGSLGEITFSSQSLQPSTQAGCFSGGTQYMLLTGKTSKGLVHRRWRISVEAKSPDMRERLKKLLIGGKSGRHVSTTLLLLFSTERGTDSRHAKVPRSSQTLSFLCELRRFLGDVLPWHQPESPPLQLDSLQSLPPLTLGLSSSENLLAGLINSSTITIFSFTSSMFPLHRGELAMPAALLEELRRRLEQTVVQITEVMREQDMGHMALMRLERLKELSAFPKVELAAGDRQYRAFLLLKALQTVASTYDVERRTTRADPSSSVRGNICGLRSLTVSLERHLVGPNTANIYNCDGSCAFPMVNTINHAVLLNSHIEGGKAQERPPCCVPVAYEALSVVDSNQDGTYISIKPDMVAKECGCR